MDIKLAFHISMLLLSTFAVALASDLSPWTSPKADGNKISVWGRIYEFNSSLLPSSIISQGDNILASPIKTEMKAKGKELVCSNVKCKLINADSEKVVYSTSADAEFIRVDCHLSTEFDGCTRVDITLTPKSPVRLDFLNISIPLKPRYATLFHHAPTYPIHVWDWPKRRLNAGELGSEGLKLPFVNHIWLGDDLRGLQVFSESDEAWSPADPENCITVTRNDDAAILRMNILANVELSKPWKWTFGFMATPVKPWPDNYYDIHYCQMGGVKNLTHSWKGEPADKDNPPYIDTLRNHGVNYLGCHESWSNEQSLPRPGNPELFKEFVKAAHKRGMAVATYTGCYMSTRSPEYNKDWDVFPVGDHWQYTRSDNGDICRIVCNNTPYSELLINSYAKAMPKFGIDGIYMDGLSCPLPCTNAKHGCGYVGKDGQIHPTMPIWRTRELMKSFWRLVKKNRNGIIMSHMSSSVLLPALSFADVYLDGEHLLNFIKIGSNEYPESHLRAEMSGHNFGIPCTQLPVRTDDPALRERARTLCLLYDSLWMWSPRDQEDIWRAYDSFGMKGVEWLPYWKTAGIIKSDDKVNIRISAYLAKGRGVLFVVANMGASERFASLAINRKGIELPSNAELIAKDATSGECLPINGDAIALPLKPGTFRMISVSIK